MHDGKRLDVKDVLEGNRVGRFKEDLTEMQKRGWVKKGRKCQIDEKGRKVRV